MLSIYSKYINGTLKKQSDFYSISNWKMLDLFTSNKEFLENQTDIELENIHEIITYKLPFPPLYYDLQLRSGVG